MYYIHKLHHRSCIGSIGHHQSLEDYGAVKHCRKRIAQDGGFRINIEQRELDVRLSVIPMQFGEGVVMRLLDKSRVQLTLNGLSVPATVRDKWQKLIAQPHGMLLVTGPTGSGKTTTLYASIQAINTQDKKIITIEDPIEYTLPGTNQIQVHTRWD